MECTVFTNYRGEDSHRYGALLYTELARHFGEDLVFLDAQSIPPGTDFVKELLGRVRSARVLLAVIGQRWLTATDTTGRRRIDDPDDWIRRELAEAFAAGVRVIPILTDHAELPHEADLPSDIAALSRCQYRPLRRREPTSDLARIVADLTSLDPVLAAAATRRDNAPRQLIGAPRHFIGRDAEMAQLTADLDGAVETGGTVLISALAGAGGIGKTVLALHWAYHNLHRFPDGQLFVDLQGFSPVGEPLEPAGALRGFLDALGVPADRIPTDLPAMAAQFRSAMAGKRMLILLDNAATADQVVSLLPDSPTCTVIVTSRRHLAGLVTRHGARHLQLGILSNAEAHRLLVDWLGIDRIDAEPTAVDELLTCCGGFPLALGIVAARACMNPRTPLAKLAAELRDDTTRLGALDDHEPTASLPAVLSWSLRALTDDQTRTFALLGIAPGTEISLPAAASLTARSEGQVRAVLRELENASLVHQHVPGRYRMHDLIRLSATDIAHQELPESVRESALRRVVDFYLHTAQTADQCLHPHPTPIPTDPPAPGCLNHPIPDTAAALTWFDTEHSCLLGAQQTALTRDWHQVVWNLAWSVSTFHDRRGHHHDRLAVWQAAFTSAAYIPIPAARIDAHRHLGYAYAEVDRHDDAVHHLNQALTLAEHRHDHQARIHGMLAWAWGRQGEDRRALEHATHARNLYRTLDNPMSEAISLNLVGWYAAQLGEYDTAREHCQAALVLQRRHHPDGQAATLDSLGYIEHRSGHHDQAIQHYRQALERLRELGNTYQLADTLDGLGHPHIALGEHEQARTAWREAQQLYREQRRDKDADRVQRQLDDLVRSPPR